MANSIDLIYKENKFIISIDNRVIAEEKNIDKAYSLFKQVVSNNSTRHDFSWDEIEEEVSKLSISGLKINSKFKTLSFENMKYFYNTEKTFLSKNNSMNELIGGYMLFRFIISLISLGQISSSDELLELCNEIVEEQLIYTVKDSSIVISSPGFNYGSVQYDFATRKFHKGSSIEKASFEEFKQYVIQRIKN